MAALRAELLAAFEAELAEHLAAIRAALADAQAGRAIDLRDVSRRAHSLKGAARAVEQPATETLAHEMEALLLAIEAGTQSLDAAAGAALRRLVDAIQDSAAGQATPGAEPGEATTDRRIRVGEQHVERLARSLHDLSNRIAAGGALVDGLEGLGTELAALGGLAERAGDDDVARGIARCAGELARLRREEARRQADIERATLALEGDAERLLLLPVETLFDGYERMVREIAASQQKSAMLRVEPFVGEADRRILQALREPMLHLLRNAVSHGIEPPAERARNGKPEQGEIVIAVALDRGRLVLTVRDDGRGLDHRRIEARARATGLLPGRAPVPDRAALEAMLFEQGFSTAETVDEVSGRGIGLSVVAETVRGLHGAVSVGPAEGGGTAFRLSVPAAQTRQTLLLIEAGGALLALPASAVARLLRVVPGEIVRSEGREVLPIEGEAIPVAALADLLGAAPVEPPEGSLPALLLRSGQRRLVLTVEALCDVRALIVGDPGAVACDTPLLMGTVLIEDRIALVLAPDALFAAAANAGAGTRPMRAAPVASPERKTVLVVDDSITTRTLEKSILEAQGYRVLVSVDGLAALERLRSGLEPVALVVADVEMPRMDGFGLLAAIRNDPLLKALPVVMMTSRNSPDDIQRGLALGANAYVTKQEFDQGTLISVVQQFV